MWLLKSEVSFEFCYHDYPTYHLWFPVCLSTSDQTFSQLLSTASASPRASPDVHQVPVIATGLLQELTQLRPAKVLYVTVKIIERGIPKNQQANKMHSIWLKLTQTYKVISFTQVLTCFDLNIWNMSPCFTKAMFAPTITLKATNAPMLVCGSVFGILYRKPMR